MNRPFNDELLSAYLDGQLSGEELAAVESELAASAQSRQLLEELRSLSQQLRELPQHTAGPEFADRVVQAALAAKAAEQNGNVQLARPGAAGSSRGNARRSNRLPIALASLAAVAAAVALAIWPWLNGGPAPLGPGQVTTVPIPGPEPVLASAAEAALAQLRLAVPNEGEAVVIRLRVGADGSVAQVIDTALGAAGIAYRSPSDDSTGASQIAAAYRRQVAEKFGNAQPGPPSPALLEGTIAAADAVFVEASWESLEKAFGTLASGTTPVLSVCPLSQFAVAAPAGSDLADAEGGSKTKGVDAAGANYAQRLNAAMFRLEKALDEAATEAARAATVAAAPIDGQRTVRVLILVEQAN